MEFILINENKMTVMLSVEDLEEFEIEADELDYANTDTKRMFWDILSRAKHSTGFDTDGQRVLVQLYPSRHGGCEMFVTKIGILTNADCTCDEGTEEEALFTEKITVRPRTERGRLSKKQLTAFGFEKLDFLLTVCKRLSHLGYNGESSAYIGDNNRFYLFLGEYEQKGYTCADKLSFICEFGSTENRENTKLYLGEHGRSICNSNAVSVLSKL